MCLPHVPPPCSPTTRLYLAFNEHKNVVADMRAALEDHTAQRRKRGDAGAAGRQQGPGGVGGNLSDLMAALREALKAPEPLPPSLSSTASAVAGFEGGGGGGRGVGSGVSHRPPFAPSSGADVGSGMVGGGDAGSGVGPVAALAALLGKVASSLGAKKTSQVSDLGAKETSQVSDLSGTIIRRIPHPTC